jgi:hypothetical protein
MSSLSFFESENTVIVSLTKPVEVVVLIFAFDPVALAEVSTATMEK